MHTKTNPGMAVFCQEATYSFEIDIIYHSAPLIRARNAEFIARHWTGPETRLLSADHYLLWPNMI